MAGLMRGRRQNGIQIPGIVSARGLMSATQGLSNSLEGFGQQFQQMMGQRLQDEERAAAIRYQSQAISDDAGWWRENEDQYVDDPAAAEEALANRREVMIDGAAEHLDPVNQAILERSLMSTHRTRLDRLYANKEVRDKNDAFTSWKESLDIQFQEINNQARQQGSLAIDLNDEHIKLLLAATEDHIDAAGLEDATLNNGQTMADVLRNNLEVKIREMHGEAVAKDALLTLHEDGQDAAFQAINEFVEKGPSKFSPEERRAMGTIAEAAVGDALNAQREQDAKTSSQEALVRARWVQDRLDQVQAGIYGLADLEKEMMAGEVPASSYTQLRTAIRNQRDNQNKAIDAHRRVAEKYAQGADFGDAPPDEQKILDDAFTGGIVQNDGSTLFQGVDMNADPETLMQSTPNIVSFVKDTGYVPMPVKQALNSTMTEIDNIDRIKAMVGIYNGIKSSNPAVLEKGGIYPSTTAFLSQISDLSLAGENAMDSLRAVQQRVYGPKDDRDLRLKTFLGGQDPQMWMVSNLREAMEDADGGIWTDLFDTYPDIDPNLAGDRRFVQDAMLLLENNFSMYQTPERALKDIGGRLFSMWGRSSFAQGGDNYMRRPPEKFWKDAQGSTDYIRWQVAEWYGERLSNQLTTKEGLNHDQLIDGYGEQWWLEPHPSSNNRAKPSYLMKWVEDGVINTEMDGVSPAMFTPDPSMSKDVREYAALSQEWHEALKDAPTPIKMAAQMVNLPARSKNRRDLVSWLRRGMTGKVAKYLLDQPEDLGDLRPEIEAMAQGDE